MILPADPMKGEAPPSDARRRTLVDSLRTRYRKALQERDPVACRALFREAVYLRIPIGELEKKADPEPHA